MSKILKAKATSNKEGDIIEVEVPGYSKEDITVEVQSVVSSILAGFVFEGTSFLTKRLSILANNETRGRSVLVLDLVNEYVDIDEIEAKVSNGILTILVPFKKKHKARIIPVS